jgi:SAM-dependent methyltransferase
MNSQLYWKIFNKILEFTNKPMQIYFGYSYWHNIPYNAKPYCKTIVNYENNKAHQRRIAEIGCGTADILRRIQAHDKIGYDISAGALKAAKLYHRLSMSQSTLKTELFDITKSGIRGLFDTIIMVNFAHNIPTEVLEPILSNIFNHNLTNSGELLIDSVSGPNYEFHHDIPKIAKNLNLKYRQIKAFDDGRFIWTLSKRLSYTRSANQKRIESQ